MNGPLVCTFLNVEIPFWPLLKPLHKTFPSQVKTHGLSELWLYKCKLISCNAIESKWIDAVILQINWTSIQHLICECSWYVGCWSSCVFWYLQYADGAFVCFQHTRRMTSRMRSPKRAVSPNRLSISLRTRTNLSLELWTVETAPGEDCFYVCACINPSAFPPSVWECVWACADDVSALFCLFLDNCSSR